VPSDDELIDTLREAQRVGALGGRSLVEVVEHARAFVRALDDIEGTVADLGTGGGVPGLVLAMDRPDLRVVLVDRSEKRTDLVRRSVRRLHLDASVEVRTADVQQLAAAEPATFDAVVARGFGPPEHTLRLAVALTRAGGAVVISDPPGSDRWPPELLAELDVRRRDVGPVSRFDLRSRTTFHVEHPCG
jgi:16S rRNA (guanine527-N7)-methyltransferase